MSRLRYFTEQSVASIRENVYRHVDEYYALLDSDQPLSFISADRGIQSRMSRLEAPSLRGQLLDGERGELYPTDVLNALTVHRSLSQLTPHQASDERLWAYLAHTECARYVARRWLKASVRERDRNDAKKAVLNHFFANGNRALIRDNGISRLWWLGHIAQKVDPDRPKQFLDILLYKQDVRSALIERPSVSMNIEVLRSIYNVMYDYWMQKDLRIFERAVFRSWMIALNTRGGVTLFDVLSDVDRSRIVRDEAQMALRLHGAVTRVSGAELSKGASRVHP